MSDDQDKGAAFVELAIKIIGYGGLILGLGALLLWGCIARAQEGPTIELPPLKFAEDATGFFHFGPSQTVFVARGVPLYTNAVIERRSAHPPVPALPQPRQRVITRTTNSEQEIITVILEKPVQPEPLRVKRQPWTNTFWIMCTECESEAIRKPLRIEKMGTRTVEDGDEHEYFIYFRCCDQEIKSKYTRKVATPIAVPVQVPVK